MDDALAFCLNRFIDDQVQFVDDRIEKIKEEEIVKCHDIEEQQAVFIKNKPPAKDKGSHAADKKLVDRFIEDLRNSSTEPNKTRTVIDDQTCIDTLRAELKTKVNACEVYITRLRTLAQPLPNSAKFVQTCKEASDYFRRAQDFEDNFKTLYSIIEQSESDDIIPKIHKWWKDTYGSILIDINQRNQKFNGAITDNNVTVISAASRIITNAKKLIAVRQVIQLEPTHFDIVHKFVRELLALDEEKRNEINADELIDQLTGRDIEQIIAYAENWLTTRDDIRNQKEEDPYEGKMEEAKADFGRQRIAQEAKKLALAALLCRLAVGSDNTEQFSNQLKKTVNKQKQKNEESVPVISGDIRDPEVDDLAFMLQLELDTTDMDQWENNTNRFRQRFFANLCQAFGIPDGKIRLQRIERDKAIIHLCVLPPYGKVVVDSLNGGARDAAARMQAVRKCCFDADINIESITVGEFGLEVEAKLMDPRWNKKYAWSSGNPAEGEFWSTPINQGGRPYFCPSGWKRFGVKVAADNKEFDERWGTWYMAYHGTRHENASKILTSGLKVSTTGCFYGEGEARVYVSPSIEYCAHPRYAYPWKQTNKDGKNLWYQLVFQCRVNPKSIKHIGPETLIKDEFKKTVTIDKNFKNTEMEWVILPQSGQEFIKDNIICYGLVMRLSEVDPATLTPSSWWKQSHNGDLHHQ